MAHNSAMNKRAAVLLFAAAGCSDPEFPDDFVFGTAVAGFQVDMGCPTLPAAECEDPHSDWYAFITSTVAIARSGNFLRGDPPSSGPGFYETYEADLDRAQSLGLTGFRFSIEWSRIFPSSTVGIEGHEALSAIASQPALEYYRAQLRAMKERGLTPLVTLNHYTLPSWLHDAVGCNLDLDRCSPRGWLEPYAVAEIAKYAGFVARELGGEIDTWATENEPLAVVLPGYLLPSMTRTNPPAVSLRINEAKTVIFNLIAAHARMYDAVKAEDPTARVGIVYNVAPVAPKDPSRALDLRAASNVYYLYNTLFLDAVLKGVLDDDLDGKGELDAALANRCDYLGVNYYTRVTLSGEEDSLFPEFSPLATFNPLTLTQGEPYAAGMYEAVMAIKEKYPELPMIITENGADSAMYDSSLFLEQHLAQLVRAMADGAKVEGYYWWSLIDNYEWNHGMHMKFGLYGIDPTDPLKARTEKPVAATYRRIVSERKVGMKAE